MGIDLSWYAGTSGWVLELVGGQVGLMLIRYFTEEGKMLELVGGAVG